MSSLYYHKLKRWANHQHFGLRTEWLELYLRHPDDWETKGNLGVNQVLSLKEWLKTTGILTKNKTETELAKQFRENGLNDYSLWEILWVNVVFNYPTAFWYVNRMGKGNWTSSDLRKYLSEDLPHLSIKTVNNAILELVGLLERTIIGKELSQGIVEGKTNRTVTRLGLECPSKNAILYNFKLLFEKFNGKIDLRTDCGLFPWTIFGSHQDYCINILLTSDNKYKINSNIIEIAK